MAMNPRLLRPILSGDPDALRYIAAVQAADQQSLEPAVRKAISDFVVGCKADGIWDAIKASCILAGARTLTGALTPLVGTAPTNNGPFVSGDYNRETGLVGNGTSKWLNSNRNNQDDPQDDFHLAAYASTPTTSATTQHIAAGGTVNADSSLIQSSTQFTTRCRTTGATNQAAGLVGVGLFGVSRSVSSEYIARGNGTNATTVVASNSRTSDSVYIFRRASTAAPGYFDGRLAFYSIGESLDLALLDTRVSALITAIGAAI